MGTTGNQWLDMLAKFGGYYDCPKSPDGRRLGPLVGYAGKDPETGKNYVGERYANCAKLERSARALSAVVSHMAAHIRHSCLGNFCGAPEGGKALATLLSQHFYMQGFQADPQYIFPGKRTLALKTPTSREKSELVFDRHEPEAGEEWWITEDVCNNFSTTAELVALIESHGASVGGIICFLNRSLDVEDTFSAREGLVLPVVSLVRMPIPQFRQDDPEVAEDIARGNVVWKPKDEWDQLEKAVNAATN